MLVLGKLSVKLGYVQVGPKDLKVIGGSVAKLVDKWEANRLVEMTGRVFSGQVYKEFIPYMYGCYSFSF